MELVRALNRGLEILLCLAKENREIGATELAFLLDLPKATVIRLAQTLEKRNFLKQNSQTGAYCIGTAVLQLSDSFIAQLDFRKTCRTCMEELRNLTNESVSLYTAEGDKRICIDRVDSTDIRTPIIKVGYLVPINVGAAGKVLLAFDNKRLSNYGVSEEVLTETFNNAYAISYSERVSGITAVAVPVFNSDGNIVCTISINGPSQHFQDKRLETIIKVTIAAGQKASTMLGYSKR